jgi:lysine-N-methylase
MNCAFIRSFFGGDNMIFRYPYYYRKFRCKADKCSDSCCIGWEIDIDSETEKYYRSIGGDFGKRLSENIADGSFVLTAGERCPFLDSTGLCDIYIELGADKLCQICSDHPRYYEWFGSVKEGGIGLCCEAAADLILSEEHIYAEEEVPDEDCEDYDTELFELLCSARETIISHLQNDELSAAVNGMLSFAEELQNNIDCGEYSLPVWDERILPERADIRSILERYTRLEPIDENWIPYIKDCISEIPETGAVSPEFSPYIRRILVYFIYRYFLKGTFDAEVLSRTKLAALSGWFIAYLWQNEMHKNGKCTHEQRVCIAKNYSKETEYCEENIAALSDAFYEDDAFSSSRLTWLYIGL